MTVDKRTRALPIGGPFSEVDQTTWLKSTGVVTNRQHQEAKWGDLSFSSRFQGRQTTVSENHPQWRRRKRGSSGDIGGEFSSVKQYCANPFLDNVTLNGSGETATLASSSTYSGVHLPYPFAASGESPFPPYWASSNTELDAAGATAIARCKPTNNPADAATFLGELVAGAPKQVGSLLFKEKTKEARKRPAEEYLNAEFGWLPIARDVGNFVNVVANSDALLSQYERDAGKVVRRRFEFPTEEEVSEITFKSNIRPYIVYNGFGFYKTGTTPSGKVMRIRKKVRKRWFSGAFTYHLPTGYNSRNVMVRSAARVNHLLGIQLTPDTVWNLAPWSWAVDWFSNTGDVISNLSDWATDGLVMKYGYMMERTSIHDTYTYVGPTDYKSSSARPTPLTFVSETKLRRKANPFGFGLEWGMLSPRQWAIAAALGISKS